MLFNSPEYFLAFLPLVVVCYFLLNSMGQVQAGRLGLVFASLFFYGYWNPVYLILIVGSMLVNFGISMLIHRLKQRPGPLLLNARALLVLGLVLNLGLLGYYKYSDFFIENINLAFDMQIPTLNLLLPLAISFFTFQQIAYLVDCYKSDVYEYDFISYCLFVSFFPQLVAGPIVHHKEMMPQFSDRHNTSVDIDNIARGILIFCIGLFKKVVVADTFAIWANAGFDTREPLSTFDAWVTSLSYTFQLYYDFSGYTDMAIGAALLFNIRLPINFNSPYKALNIQDFWRRWHMTLSRWLRDYLYIPLGGNRCGTGRMYFNLMTTFVLGGLWHGAGWTFIVWGAMHGSALVVHRLWEKGGRKMAALPAWALTFLFANFTWVFFRADTMEAATRILKSMVGFSNQAFVGSVEPFVQVNQVLGNAQPAAGGLLSALNPAVVFIAVFGLIAFLSRNSMEIASERTRFSIVDAVRVSGSLLLTLLLGIASSSTVFLYFNF
ncbi:MAG: MBOAT family protein [Halioglobus sp.]